MKPPVQWMQLSCCIIILYNGQKLDESWCNELIPVEMTWLPIETALGPVMAWGKGPASFQDEPPSTRISDESMIPYKMKYNLSRRQVILVFHFYFQANVICANLNVAKFYCCFVLAFCLSIVKSIIKWCSTHNQIYLTRRDYIIYLKDYRD